MKETGKGLKESSIVINSPDASIAGLDNKKEHFLGEKSYTVNIDKEEEKLELIDIGNNGNILNKYVTGSASRPEQKSTINELAGVKKEYSPTTTEQDLHITTNAYKYDKLNEFNPTYQSLSDDSQALDTLYTGSTPWDLDTGWGSGVIKTNVDKQDERLFEDITPSDMSGMSDALKNSGKNLVNNLGVVKGLNKYKTSIANQGKVYIPEDPKLPNGLVGDKRFTDLQIIKSKKYKNIKMMSKLGTYNTLENLLGFASGAMVGSLGKSMVSNIADDMTSKFTGGLGVAGLVERLGGAMENLPTLEEIVALNLANYYNMYTAKPGRLVYDRYHKFNFITPNITDGIDGTKEGNNWRDIAQGALNKISGAVGYVSSWLDGSKATKIIRNITNDTKAWENYIRSEQRIISYKRGEKERTIEELPKFKDTPVVYGDTYEYFYDAGKQFSNDSRSSSLKNRMRQDPIFKSNEGVSFGILGGLYIEPYFSNNCIKCESIPFEFNPIINDGGSEAKYATEELLGRLLAVRSYTGSSSNSITLETKYLATAPSGAIVDDNKTNVSWFASWTPEQILEIEKKYRKLVLPYIKGDIFVKPPIVRIKMGNLDDKAQRVSSLFSYPDFTNTQKKDSGDFKTLSDFTALEVTSSIDEITREKRYIVTNLTINPINSEDFGNAYYIGDYEATTEGSADSKTSFFSYRRGFTVTLTLAETTKNFLDTIPNYYHYSNNSDANTTMVSTQPSINNTNYMKSDKPDKQKLYDIFDLKIKGIPDYTNIEGGQLSVDTNPSPEPDNTDGESGSLIVSVFSGEFNKKENKISGGGLI